MAGQLNISDLLTKASSYRALLLPDWLIQGLRLAGFHEPSPLHCAAIPIVQAGRDILIEAPPGPERVSCAGIAALQHFKPGVKSAQVLFVSARWDEECQGVMRHLTSKLGEAQRQYRGEELDATHDHTTLDKLPSHIFAGTAVKINQMLARDQLMVKTIKLLILEGAEELMADPRMHTICAALPHTKQVLAFNDRCTDRLGRQMMRLMQRPHRLFQAHVPRPFYKIVSEEECQLHGEFGAKQDAVLRFLCTSEFNQAVVFTHEREDSGLALTAELEAHSFPTAFLAGSPIAGNAADIVSSQTRVVVAPYTRAHNLIIEHANAIVMFDLPPVPSAYGGCMACVKAAQPAVSVAFVSESELPVLQKLLKGVRLAQARELPPIMRDADYVHPPQERQFKVMRLAATSTPTPSPPATDLNNAPTGSPAVNGSTVSSQPRQHVTGSDEENIPVPVGLQSVLARSEHPRDISEIESDTGPSGAFSAAASSSGKFGGSNTSQDAEIYRQATMEAAHGSESGGETPKRVRIGGAETLQEKETPTAAAVRLQRPRSSPRAVSNGSDAGMADGYSTEAASEISADVPVSTPRFTAAEERIAEAPPIGGTMPMFELPTEEEAALEDGSPTGQHSPVLDHYEMPAQDPLSSEVSFREMLNKNMEQQRYTPPLVEVGNGGMPHHPQPVRGLGLEELEDMFKSFPKAPAKVRMRPTREASLLADCQTGGEEMNDTEIEEAIIAAHGSGPVDEDGYDVDRTPRASTGQISAQSEEDAATLAAYLALSTEDQQQLWEAYYQCVSADDADGPCTPDPHTGAPTGNLKDWNAWYASYRELASPVQASPKAANTGSGHHPAASEEAFPGTPSPAAVQPRTLEPARVDGEKESRLAVVSHPLRDQQDARLALLPLLKSIDQNPDEEGFVRVPVDLVARYYELEAQHWGRMLQQGGSIPSATSKDSRAMM